MSGEYKALSEGKGKNEGNAGALRTQGLRSRRLELVERARAVQKDLQRESDPASAQCNESQRSNNEVLEVIGEAGARKVAGIESAVRRLDSGRYGPRDRRDLPHVSRPGAAGGQLSAPELGISDGWISPSVRCPATLGYP
jgi:hypothetical protein